MVLQHCLDHLFLAVAAASSFCPFSIWCKVKDLISAMIEIKVKNEIGELDNIQLTWTFIWSNWSNKRIWFILIAQGHPYLGYIKTGGMALCVAEPWFWSSYCEQTMCPSPSQVLVVGQLVRMWHWEHWHLFCLQRRKVLDSGKTFLTRVPTPW